MPLDMFHRNKSKADGHNDTCKPCRQEYDLRRDKARRVQDAARWAAANPERVRASRKSAYARHREQRLAAKREYYRDNPCAAQIYVARRRARKLSQHVEDVHRLVVLERADGVCGVCGGDVDPLDFHVDHIVPLVHGGDHSYANTQATHPSCNLRKGAYQAARAEVNSPDA